MVWSGEKRVEEATCQALNLDPLREGDTFHLGSSKQSGEAPDLFDRAPIAVYIPHLCLWYRSQCAQTTEAESRPQNMPNVPEELLKAFVMEQNTVEGQSFL